MSILKNKWFRLAGKVFVELRELGRASTANVRIAPAERVFVGRGNIHMAPERAVLQVGWHEEFWFISNPTGRLSQRYDIAGNSIQNVDIDHRMQGGEYYIDVAALKKHVPHLVSGLPPFPGPNLISVLSGLC